jgi:hypothetical protein
MPEVEETDPAAVTAAKKRFPEVEVTFVLAPTVAAPATVRVLPSNSTLLPPLVMRVPLSVVELVKERVAEPDLSTKTFTKAL